MEAASSLFNFMLLVVLVIDAESITPVTESNKKYLGYTKLYRKYRSCSNNCSNNRDNFIKGQYLLDVSIHKQQLTYLNAEIMGTIKKNIFHNINDNINLMIITRVNNYRS